jgi:hypothetical protein
MDVQGLPTLLFYRRNRFPPILVVHIHYHHTGTLLSEQQRGLTTDATGSPGDQRNLIVQPQDLSILSFDRLTAILAT